MSKQPLDFNARETVNCRRKVRSSFIGLHANAAHSGIQRQMDLRGFLQSYCHVRQWLCLLHGEDGRADFFLNEFLITGWMGHAQN